MALNKKNRLKRKKDFERVYRKGKAAKGNFLFAKYLKNNLNHPRFAFIVSLKVSKKAVDRNRIRRVLSEMIRLKLDSLAPFDVILSSDKKLADISSKIEIQQDVDNILSKIK